MLRRFVRTFGPDKLMRAFLDEDVYQGRVRIDREPRHAPSQASLLDE